MKRRSATLLLLLLIPAFTFAQSSLQHPDDPEAELVGSYQATVNPDPIISRSSIESESSNENECNTGGTVWVWRTVGGRIDYVLDVTSIQFTGLCCGADSMSTPEIFDRVSRAGLEQGIILGLSPCPASCATPITARVYTAACVQRSGSCSTTSFTPCTELLAFREYSYCCVNGVPMITAITSSGGSCTSPCESTTGTGGGSLQ